MYKRKLTVDSFLGRNLLCIIFLFIKVGEMYPEEDLPSNICESCLSDVIYCYEFKVKFEKSQSILQSLLKNQITKEVPLDTVKRYENLKESKIFINKY